MTQSSIRQLAALGATLVVGLAAMLAPVALRAELTTVGSGKALAFDPAQFDEQQRPRYTLFAARCSKCHPIGRPITAIKTGVTPVTNSPFDGTYVKKYVLKMMRKPNSGITKEDAREIILFLRYAVAVDKGLPPPEAEPAGDASAE